MKPSRNEKGRLFLLGSLSAVILVLFLLGGCGGISDLVDDLNNYDPDDPNTITPGPTPPAPTPPSSDPIYFTDWAIRMEPQNGEGYTPVTMTTTVVMNKAPKTLNVEVKGEGFKPGSLKGTLKKTGAVATSSIKSSAASDAALYYFVLELTGLVRDLEFAQARLTQIVIDGLLAALSPEGLKLSDIKSPHKTIDAYKGEWRGTGTFSGVLTVNPSLLSDYGVHVGITSVGPVTVQGTITVNSLSIVEGRDNQRAILKLNGNIRGKARGKVNGYDVELEGMEAYDLVDWMMGRELPNGDLEICLVQSVSGTITQTLFANPSLGIPESSETERIVDPKLDPKRDYCALDSSSTGIFSPTSFYETNPALGVLTSSRAQLRGQVSGNRITVAGSASGTLEGESGTLQNGKMTLTLTRIR